MTGISAPPQVSKSACHANGGHVQTPCIAARNARSLAITHPYAIPVMPTMVISVPKTLSTSFGPLQCDDRDFADEWQSKPTKRHIR